LLSLREIEELKKFDTPTVANAIERFDIRLRTAGFMSPKIKSIIQYARPFVGYASTAKISAQKPATPEQKALIMEYYSYVQKTSAPTLTVIEDLDLGSVGSFWGEVNASIHIALGCVGVITNGGVRDLEEVERLNFGYFASCILVSHAYVHIEDFNCSVEVGDLTVNPGDLLHADKHGVISIPSEIASDLVEACRKVQYAEEPIIKNCQKRFNMGINIDDLRQWREEMTRRRNSE